MELLIVSHLSSIIQCRSAEYQMNGIYHISSIFLKEKEMLYGMRATEAVNYRTL